MFFSSLDHLNLTIKSWIKRLMLPFIIWGLLFLGINLSFKLGNWYLQKKYSIKTRLDFFELKPGLIRLGLKDFDLHLAQNLLTIKIDQLAIELLPLNWWKKGINFINFIGQKVSVELPTQSNRSKDLIHFLRETIMVENPYLNDCNFKDCKLEMPHSSANSVLDTMIFNAILNTQLNQLQQPIKKLTIFAHLKHNQTKSLQLKLIENSTSQTSEMLDLTLTKQLDDQTTEIIDGTIIVKKQNSLIRLNYRGQECAFISQEEDKLKITSNLSPELLSEFGILLPLPELQLKIAAQNLDQIPQMQFLINKLTENRPLVWGNSEINPNLKQCRLFFNSSVELGNLHGAIDYQPDTGLLIGFANTTSPLKCGATNLPPAKLKAIHQLHLSHNQSPEICFEYQFDKKTNGFEAGFGQLQINNFSNGSVNVCFANQLNLNAEINLDLPLKIKALRCKYGNHLLCSASVDERLSGLKGFVNSQTIQQYCLPEKAKFHLNGHLGKAFFIAQQKHNNVILVKFATQPTAGISYANLINPLERISGQLNIDSMTQTIALKRFSFLFNYGKVLIPRGKIVFDQNWQKINALNFNARADRLLCNKNQCFFALVNANLNFDWDSTLKPLPSLNGTIELAKSCYNKNFIVFEEEPIPTFLQPNEEVNQFLPNIELGLNIKSKQPMNIDSLGIGGKTNLNLNIVGQLDLNQLKLQNPQLQGRIEFIDGRIKILGNDLNIKHCTCKFIPGFGTVPFIDILAYNKIKKYNLSMHAFGSLAKPNVHFNSNPEMNEEQIATFLMSGFGDKSKSLMQFLPGILIKSLEDEIFKTNKSISKLGQMIKNITNPTHGLKISPCLIDSKIDNLGAAVSFNLGPKLHALARKGLNMHDHLSLQMEYLLSPNLSLKVGRASQGNLEGELELKFKF